MGDPDHNRYRRALGGDGRGQPHQFNNVVYEEAAKAGIDYVSLDVLWEGHAPCGAKGKWTNSRGRAEGKH